MTYPNDAAKLANAWVTVGMPIDRIAEMYLILQEILTKEREQSAFLEQLLATRHGDGWEKLTIVEAEKYYMAEKKAQWLRKKRKSQEVLFAIK